MRKHHSPHKGSTGIALSAVIQLQIVFIAGCPKSVIFCSKTCNFLYNFATENIHQKNTKLYRIYVEDKLQNFRKSGILASTRSIASELENRLQKLLFSWNHSKFTIGKSIQNWFGDQVFNVEAIDLVDPKIPDFRNFCNSLSSRYILWKNIKIRIRDPLHHIFSSFKHFSSVFQHLCTRFVQRAWGAFHGHT